MIAHLNLRPRISLEMLIRLGFMAFRLMSITHLKIRDNSCLFILCLIAPQSKESWKRTVYVSANDECMSLGVRGWISCKPTQLNWLTPRGRFSASLLEVAAPFGLLATGSFTRLGWE